MVLVHLLLVVHELLLQGQSLLFRQASLFRLLPQPVQLLVLEHDLLQLLTTPRGVLRVCTRGAREAISIHDAGERLPHLSFHRTFLVPLFGPHPLQRQFLLVLHLELTVEALEFAFSELEPGFFPKQVHLVHTKGAFQALVT